MKMQPSLAGRANYDLLSISNHAGAGMNGGHYFAYLDLNTWTAPTSGGSGGGSGDSSGRMIPRPPSGPTRSVSEGGVPHDPSSPSPSLKMGGGDAPDKAKDKDKEKKGYNHHKAKWVVCDDERVQRIKSVEGAGSSAYMLFYKLRE